MRLHSIQFLRAIAALLVVYSHSIDLQMKFSVSHQQKFLHVENFGAIGVDIFFAISGFIITFIGNTHKGSESALNFLIKRFLRINPIFYVASLVYLCLMIILKWTNNLIAPDGYFVNAIIDSLFIIPIAGQIEAYVPLLIVTWTLSFEWLFYILFIVLILFRSNQKALHLLIVLPLLVAVGYFIPFKDFRWTFITNPIILEFLLGVIVCWFYLNKKVSNSIAYLLLFFGLLCYLLQIWYGYGKISEVQSVLNGELSLKRFIVWGIPSACLVAGCIFLEKNAVFEKVWRWQIFQLLGDASYSIYLVHLSVFLVLHLMYLKLGFFMNPDLSIFVHVLIAAVVSVAFYLFIERPLLRMLTGWFSQRSEAVLSRAA